MKKTQRIFSWLIAMVMLLSCFGSIGAERLIRNTDGSLEKTETTNVEDPNKDVTILVKLDQKTAYVKGEGIDAAVKASGALLKEQAKVQKNIEDVLNTKIEVENSYTILYNGFSFEGKLWMIDEINKLSGVHAFVPMEFEVLGTSDNDLDLKPTMSNSTITTGASEAWELGYDGEGAVIAVIDTGIRATHEAFSVMPENGRIDKAYLEEVYAEYGDVMHAGKDVDQLYKNEKIPFGWDYFDNDYDPNHTASDHGTHVSGIAAGNNGSDFKGVAPNAQIVSMQVFTDAGGASFATLLLALEDCACLGVDAINMSLGLTTGYTDPDSVGVDGFDDALQALENAGVSINVAAGNDSNTLTWTNYGDYFVSRHEGLASNPDIGLVSSPATFSEALAVASVMNSSSNAGYLVVNDEEYLYTSIGGQPAIGELAGEVELAYVEGVGNPEQFEAADVEGKIAVVIRGDLAFTDKCTNAAAAGAAGIIIYNNVAGTLNPSITSEIPVGFLTLEDGERLVAAIEDGHTTGTVYTDLNYGSVGMASSSSWGTTADLKIKPEISAPGDGVTSSTGFTSDSAYESWSGTSMATPHIAAAIALIKQHVQDLFPDATPAEIIELAHSFAMSTAHQVQGFVRQQGAGMIDIASAVSTDVYLSVDGQLRPKLEIGDSENGEFTLTFKINNVGDESHTYRIVPSAMTENVYVSTYTGTYYIPNDPVDVKLINGTVKDVTDMVNFECDNEVTVPANGTVEITVELKASEELMEYFDEYCESGMYLEGFIKLEEVVEEGEEGIDLSIPYLGFVGDWDYASMLDRGYYYQNATGEMNYMQMSTSMGNFVGFTANQGLGLNQYADMTGETYLPDRNAISPNGDGNLDEVSYIEITMMRNAKTVKLYIESEDGELLEDLYEGNYTFRKDYYTGSMNGGDSIHTLSFDYAMDDLDEDETVYVVLESILDHEGYVSEDNESGLWKIPVTKDTLAPEIRVENGNITIVDHNYIAYYAVYGDEELTNELRAEGVFAEERGEEVSFTVDQEIVYITVADYAGNEALYMVNTTSGLVTLLEGEAFNHGRTIIGEYNKNYATGYYEFGWASFKSELPGGLEIIREDNFPEIYYTDGVDVDILSTAVSANKTLYGNDLKEIYIIDPETLERETVMDMRDISGESGSISVRNILIDPADDQMYVIAYSYNVPGFTNGYGMYSVDLDNQKLEYKFGFDFTNSWETPWSATFIGDGRFALYCGSISLYIVNVDGECEDTIDLHIRKTWDYGGDIIGIYGYAGSMLYDEQTNCIYCSSDYTWFGENYYSRAGIFKYDLTNDTLTLRVTGNGNGRPITGMFFLDSVEGKEPIELESFELSTESEELFLGESVDVKFSPNPSDANQYELTWTSSNENVAFVTGNKRKGVITAGSTAGTAVITCTAVSTTTDEVVGTKTITVTVTADPELNAAANVEGGQITFWTNGEYPFVPANEGEYVESTNAFIGNTTSALHTKLYMKEGDTLNFEYFVSSEADYDYFYFLVNGEEEIKESGELGWQDYTFTAPEDGVYMLDWVFEKDPATDGDIDVVRIKNVEFSGEIVNPQLPGDVDGDGVVTVMDALKVMRIAMGVENVTDAEMEIADYNGDGTVEGVDALAVLRVALGLE